MTNDAAAVQMTLHLSVEQLQYIAGVLAQRPYAEVAALIAEMQRQLDQQQPQPALRAVRPGQNESPVAG